MNRALADTPEIHPLTPDRWDDLAALFGTAGVQDRCWCMWWRLTSADYRRGDPARHHDALRALVAAGQVPGLLAYREGQPVGWCGLGRRAGFVRLARTRALGPFDDEPAWSIVCFFAARRERGRGVRRRAPGRRAGCPGDRGLPHRRPGAPPRRQRLPRHGGDVRGRRLPRGPGHGGDSTPQPSARR